MLSQKELTVSSTLDADPKSKKLPTRIEVAEADTWDLASLCVDDDQWETLLSELESMVGGFEQFRGRLGDSPEVIRECFEFDMQLDQLAEKVGTYAFLRTTEDQANSHYQGFVARFQNIAVKASQAGSFISPELLSIPDETMSGYMASETLAPFQLSLQRILRRKPHTLSAGEERLLAMQGEMAQTASSVFRQLTDSDLKFGMVKNEDGDEVELSNSTFSSFLISPDRDVRKTAFHQFYQQFDGHRNSLAASLTGSIHKDVYYARARNHESALSAALFPDNVPASVYENLVAAVRSQLPAVHDYFDMRRRKMGLDSIHHYDTYVPISTRPKIERSWDEAVRLVIDSLHPLGQEYTQTLSQGLLGRWCDRYPNAGKQSGAFSCGTFAGDPYIMMNYKPAVLNDVFTLAHEAGHSMHSHYSASNQPYQYYDYTIFVAEVASTFNEQLLTHHLLKDADRATKIDLLNHEVDSIRATIVRQTMFAEFEMKTHAMAEAGEPLTVESLRSVYGELLRDYFGPKFTIDEELSLECLRIPHFYRAFYVYKYATGLSAAIALSRRVLEGGTSELEQYLSFLKGGCSKDPLELLRDAGVDMTTPEPVATALSHFGDLVSELDSLVG
jgi:oligoendopeptidase F